MRADEIPEHELKQASLCPKCGWTQTNSDSVTGLGAIHRTCQNHRCRTSFLVVYRDSELVGSTLLHGHTPQDYREALRALDSLTPDEEEQLVAQAEERAEKLGRYQRAC